MSWKFAHKVYKKGWGEKAKFSAVSCGKMKAKHARALIPRFVVYMKLYVILVGRGTGVVKLMVLGNMKVSFLSKSHQDRPCGVTSKMPREVEGTGEKKRAQRVEQDNHPGTYRSKMRIRLWGNAQALLGEQSGRNLQHQVQWSQSMGVW